jgi:glycosyltransferase involved in cell wall biosynthesis
VCKDIFLNAITANPKSKNSNGVLRIFRAMQAESSHILILPKWYPHPNDPQNGSFIKHYALEMSKVNFMSVIFPVAGSENQSPLVFPQDNFLEILVPYKQLQIPFSPARKLLNFFSYMNAMKRGYKALLKQKSRPDLIHVHVLIRPAMFASRLSRRRNIPWVLTEHSSDFLNDDFVNDNMVKRFFVKGLCNKEAHGISAVSTRLAEGLKNMGVHQYIDVIPNMLVFPKQTISRESGKILRIAAAADLVDHIKNISAVIHALAEKKAVLGDFEFHLIGDGPDRQRLETLVERLDLKSHVIFHGRQPHEYVLDFLPTISFLITNSFTETFSLITAEAVACGKPVIVTRCGGPEEWFKPEYGLMIEPGNQKELEEALVKMAVGYRAFSSERMQASIREQFDPEKVIQQYLDFYQKVLKH